MYRLNRQVAYLAVGLLAAVGIGAGTANGITVSHDIIVGVPFFDASLGTLDSFKLVIERGESSYSVTIRNDDTSPVDLMVEIEHEPDISSPPFLNDLLLARSDSNAVTIDPGQTGTATVVLPTDMIMELYTDPAVLANLIGDPLTDVPFGLGGGDGTRSSVDPPSANVAFVSDSTNFGSVAYTAIYDYTPAVAAAGVPEPLSATLGLMGLATLAGATSRRHRNLVG